MEVLPSNYLRKITLEKIRLGLLKIRKAFTNQSFEKRRISLSSKYISGSGIEIGALHLPLKVPAHAQIRYVDRLCVEDLLKHYPELTNMNLIEPDVLDNGETLSQFPDNSLNFIIANHFLEHCENPLGTMRNHLSKLKHGGVLYYAVPNKKYTFDKLRTCTSFDHVMQDDISGAQHSREEHFREWSTLVNRTKGEKVDEEVRHLMNINYSIHFHVWDFKAFKHFLYSAREYLTSEFKLEELRSNHNEIIAVIRKLNK